MLPFTEMLLSFLWLRRKFSVFVGSVFSLESAMYTSWNGIPQF